MASRIAKPSVRRWPDIELFPEFAKEEYKEYWMKCIYVAYSNLEYEAGKAPYTVAVNDEGRLC